MPESLHGSTKHCNTLSTRHQLEDPVGDLLASKVGQKKYATKEEARKVAEAWPQVKVLWSEEYRDQDFVRMLFECDFDIRKNDLLQRFEIHRGDGAWLHVGPDKMDGAAIRNARNYATNRFVVIKYRKIGENEWYEIQRIDDRKSWGKEAKALYGCLTGMVGDLIPTVNPLTDWIQERIDRIKAMSKEERDSLVAGLDKVFTDIPGIRPVQSEGQDYHRRLAKFAGRYYYTMLGHRLLQSHPLYASRTTKVQRNVPVLAGEHNIGKSTMARLLLPDLPGELGWMVEVRIDEAMEEIKRKMAGSLGAMLDDLDSLTGRVGGQKKGMVKELITMVLMTFRWLYENPVSVKMPCVIIGTANKMDMPNDTPTMVRFLPFLLEADRDGAYKGMDNNAVFKVAEKHIKDSREDWVLAGLVLAVEDGSFELDDQGLIDQRRALADVATDEDGIEELVRDMISTGRYHSTSGAPAISYWQLAHLKGWLRRPYGETNGNERQRMGAAILPSDTDVDNETLKAAWDTQSKSTGGRSLAHRIKEGMAKVGWELQKNRWMTGEKERGKAVLSSVFAPGVGGLMPPSNASERRPIEDSDVDMIDGCEL